MDADRVQGAAGFQPTAEHGPRSVFSYVHENAGFGDHVLHFYEFFASHRIEVRR